LIPDLPHDLIALEWGYESNHNFTEYCGRYAASGLPFYVCPGTSSWNSLTGRTDNVIANLLAAADCGLAQGAIGYLITDWGDGGHWQSLPISYLGFLYGAAVSWAREANHEIDIPRALDLFAFEDTAGVMGSLAYDLSNLYKVTGPENINGQILFYLMQTPAEKITETQTRLENWGKQAADLSPATLHRLLQRIDEIMQPLDSSTMQRDDQTLIRDEFLHAAQMLRHAAHRQLLLHGVCEKNAGQLMSELKGLMERHRTLWLARNRSGGLIDSLARFEPLSDDYRQMNGG
jgi:hexosaminidase